ncbi:hypothetical protein PIB30_118906 [Stylosanthes scabra]|uniref:Reverse transcriptase Ty1/copia-type domain-containing protein n=1 Tax=Stylosanthes scabra TaxID=79078 RepID=A0ABU6UQA1_9FABA|nr:hypothetical protein [Stylosanthes scabra]
MIIIVFKSTSSISSKSSIKYPISNYLDYASLSHKHKAFSVALTSHIEPTSYEQAVFDDSWKQAIKAELDALDENRTWMLTKLPKGKKAIGCKWIFKIKLKQDGSIERYKARLVAKGFTQTLGFDYFDTFSPVIKMTTFRLLLAIVASKNWYVHQLDVNTAFVHGDLPEKVYMKLPHGLVVQPGTICKLQKSLYGLKQASRQWNTKLCSVLVKAGFIQSRPDPCLFTKSSSLGFTCILVYVDDLVVAGDSLTGIQNLKKLLR